MKTNFKRIELEVDLPDVTERPIRIEVRCGDTTAYVHEHGHYGSGDWAAWTQAHGGHVIGEGGTTDYTQDRAIADAHEHVIKHERSRLFHDQLRRSLKAADHGEAS